MEKWEVLEQFFCVSFFFVFWNKKMQELCVKIIFMNFWQTGYMFGKGIYFADMVSKSANYCRTSKMDPTGLMLLCEVALGNM